MSGTAPSFVGKVVVVTGGSAGLGWEIARRFWAAGATVELLARRKELLLDAATRIADNQDRVGVVTADLLDGEAVDQAFAEIRARRGAVHVLVNAAGISDRGAVLDTTPDRFEQVWNLNFLGAVRCTRAACQFGDLAANGGHIVNIGSLASKVASSFLGAYPVSKFALAAYTQQLRMELEPRGVHAMLVCPGPLQRADAGNRYDDRSAHLPDSARKPGGGAQLRLLDPQAVAARIVQGCAPRERELILPGKIRWLVALGQFFPGWAERIIRRKTS